MAARARLWTPAPRQPTFTTKSLWHLAAWGLAASIALALAAAASYSNAGSRRLTVALGGSEGVLKEATSPPSSRSQDPAIEIGPLIESVRSLAAERERLTARIENIERQLNDLTGSIKAPTGASPPESMQPAGARPAREALPGAADTTSSAEAKAEFGADIGAASNFEGLRQLWTSSKARNPTLFDGLHGVVSLRENIKARTAELRLIVGPLADADAANRLCAMLTTANRYCEPAAFEGQRLADAEKGIERKPAFKRVHRTSRPFGLFQ